MKHKLLLLSIFFISLNSFAQSKTEIGISAGLIQSTIKGEAANSLENLIGYTNGIVQQKARTGLFAGAHLTIPVSEYISIQPGLQYVQKGMALKGAMDLKNFDFLSPNAKAALNAQYLELPVLIKANFGGFEISAGPQVSYLTDANLRVTAGVLGFNAYDKTYDATEQLNRWDAGISGGIGYVFPGGFNIRASYDHGLVKADADQRMDAYNRSFKIGIGMNF